MKKIIHRIIVSSLLSILFVGCGEKLSPSGEYCVSQMEKDGTGNMGDKKRDYLIQSCKDYTGSEDKETGELFSFMLETMTKKCVEEGIDMKTISDCTKDYWDTPDE